MNILRNILEHARCIDYQNSRDKKTNTLNKCEV